MAMRNPYSRYQNNAIFTATKEELTLMLYDGGLKFCNKAIVALEQNDAQKANEYIQRVQDIIREFQITLDKKYEISENLDQLYDYMVRRLVEANIKKDIGIVNEVKDMLRELRDTWKEAMIVARAQ